MKKYLALYDGLSARLMGSIHLVEMRQADQQDYGRSLMAEYR